MANLPLPHMLHGFSGFDENLPAAQAVHLVAPVAAPLSVTDPVAQTRQLVEPTPLYAPTAHSAHASFPSLDCARPDAHKLHRILPSDCWCRPGAQG